MHSVGSFRMPPVLVRSRSRLLRLSAQRPMVMFPCRGSRPMQAGSLSFFRKRPQGCRLISINSPPGARLCGDSEFRQHPQGPCRRLETLCRLGPTLKPFFPSAKPPSASTLPRASVGLLNLETFCFPGEIAELAESRSETAQGGRRCILLRKSDAAHRDFASIEVVAVRYAPNAAVFRNIACTSALRRCNIYKAQDRRQRHGSRYSSLASRHPTANRHSPCPPHAIGGAHVHVHDGPGRRGHSG
ncbi:hypothetical protein EV132_13833 [Rhizobium sullae]|uniref:Uncharacterized protein n=1 Tax=Rhizobium sullae TaxID=50338 RepID=A0A4R3PQU5_RHISU|nr:hypothetical protein EV132_13833 [Rhizobium sullae]